MKRLGIIIGVLLVTIVSPLVVQFGWNEIVTTILPVGKISFWQALGLDALLTFIYIEHCFYKKRFIRQCVEYDWCSKEYLEEVVDIRKIESEEF